MRTAIIRTGSVPALNHSFVPGSLRAKNGSASPRISLRLNVGRRRRDSRPATGIRRASSESDMIRPERSFSGLSGVGSTSFTARIPEGEECVYGGFGRRNYWTESGVPVKEAGLPSGGGGNGDWSAGKFTGGNADWSKIGVYYQEMLKTDPTNSLLLRNYAKFLDEVEGDMVKAEEYYGRAILASPGDGEVLALYGKLIWETQRDHDRAKLYFDQAIRSSPGDSMVMGSYAQFMWEAEEEDENNEEGGDGGLQRGYDPSTAMVKAF
ncbi:hypothetical protein RHGRI_031015 [Rhododendron griersonianum]|uniref:Tetratricopeptide repeat-like superfamily protein n=1 Tax=Rhododendron griersonianum TaxID=479676 RepID=A0AAV6IC49_9ERIC|nr:hypothetical protein RHGRI_031015 [Rhododendron griersonianum]